MKNILSNGLLFLYVLVTAFIDIGVKVVMGRVSPIAAGAFVSSIGALGALSMYFCRVFVFKTKKRMRFDAHTYVKLFLMSVCAGAALITSNTAIAISDPLTFRVIQIICFPLFVALIAWVSNGVGMTKKEIQSTLLAVAGFFIYFLPEISNLNFIYTGVLLSIVSALLYATVLFFTKQLASQHVPNEILITYRFVLLGICSLFFVQTIAVDLPKQYVLYILGLGVVGYWLRYELMVEGIKNLPVTAMSLYTVAIPVFTAILNRIFLRAEPYSFLQIAGLALIILALVYSVFNFSKLLHFRKANPV